MTSDHFHRLGLPRRFSIDAVELERSYLARSRTLHPDYHLAGSDAELAVSLEMSAALNEAYNTLRDPFGRAEYLLTIEGGPSASDHKQMPPAFLAEMLAAREQIELGRGNPAEVTRLDDEFRSRFAQIMEHVASLFAQYEQLPAGDAKRANLRAEVRGLLNAAKYVRGLIRDLHFE